MHYYLRQLSYKIYLILIIIHFFAGCSDPVSEPEPDNGTQFPAIGSYQGSYWPTDDWKSCKPEDVGMDSEKLMAAYDYAANPDIETDGIVIIKDGYIVGEAYFNGTSREQRHSGYSLAKNFTSALVGIAIDKDFISGVDQKIYQYFSQWQQPYTPDINKRVSIKHLLTMTGGLAWNDNPAIIDDFAVADAEDYIEYVLTKPVIHEPGTHWSYSNGEAILLSGIIQTSSGMPAHIFAKENLFSQIGITNVFWERDTYQHTMTAWGIYTSPREYARLGFLYLNEGQWDGEQIISQSWIDESTTAISDSLNHYAYYWWLPPAFSDYGKWNIPPKTIIGYGARIQLLYVVPEKDLVVVRTGQDYESADLAWSTLEFLTLILNSIKD